MGSRCVFALNKRRYNPDTAPATVNLAALSSADESDTSLKSGATAPLYSRCRGGQHRWKSVSRGLAPPHHFPLSLPHPYWIEESHVQIINRCQT